MNGVMMIASLKKVVSAVLPRQVLSAYRKHKSIKYQRQYEGLSTAGVFEKIYKDRAWGKSDRSSEVFYSGSGSHDSEVVSAYLLAIKKFLGEFPEKPDVVDLGCGDFFVGSRLRDMCGNYVACDIVSSLIEFNQKKFRDLAVDFRVLDLTEGDLPKGDIVFVRQVFQHLSNEKIKKALPKIMNNYKFLVLTEHIPRGSGFTPNLDKPTGPDIRLSLNSGIVLTEKPFDLQAIGERVIAEVAEYGGTIRTTVYQFS